MFHTPSLMSAGAAVVISPDGSHRIPADLWAEYAAIVLLEPEPKLLAVWTRKLEDGLGVNEAHRRAVAARSEPRPKWYVLRVMAQQERFVVRALGEAGVTGHTPLHVTWAKFARRKAARTRALMPGYVFAELPDDRAIDAARAIRGVNEIMCNGEGKPRRIPSLAVGALILMEACHAFDETWEPPKVKGKRYSHAWKSGDRVRITSGPMEGHVVTVLRGRGRDNMEVLFSLFGRTSEVVVPHRQLGKAA